MTNAQIRQWYLGEVGRIAVANERWMRQGVSLSDRARRCHALRQDARLKARRMMPDDDELRLLEARDRLRYGSPDGPTLDQLMERNLKAGLTEAESFAAIIEGSQRTDPLVSRSLDIKRRPK